MRRLLAHLKRPIRFDSHRKVKPTPGTRSPYRFLGPHPSEAEPRLFRLVEPSPMLEYWVEEQDPASTRFHHDDGPAVIRENGDRLFYCDGRRHRWDGPAVIGSDGYQAYYNLGRLHRLDGPAISCPSGRALTPRGVQYWIEGHRYSASEFAVLSRLLRDERQEATESLDNQALSSEAWAVLRTELEADL